MPRSSLPNIKSISKGSFEPIKKNAISLGDDDYLGKELKPIKIGGKDSILELSETDFKINGNLKDLHLNNDFTINTAGSSITFDTVGGDINFQAVGNNYLSWSPVAGALTMHPILDKDDYVKFAVSNGGSLTITTFDDAGSIGRLNFDVMGLTTFASKADGYFYFAQESHMDEASDIAENHLRLEVVENTGATTFMTVDADGADGDITLDADGDIILDPISGITKFYLAGDTDDLCTLTVAANGATSIATADSDGAVGHLTLAPDGDLVLDPVSTKVIINATDDLYFDGGGDTYITEASANALTLVAGGSPLLTVSTAIGTNNKQTVVDGAVVFLQAPAVYNASTTALDFSRAQKQFLTFGAGNITNLNLKFPLTNSGNFVLLLKQDGTGSRTITNWQAFDGDENAANGSATVKFAGGSNPTLTTDANHVDIISFYWDATTEIAYGVATLDFQF